MRKLLIALLLFIAVSLHAQDSPYARKVVDTLTSPHFWGRGYTKDGMSKAARYISSQFISFGLQPMAGKDYFQNFSYPVNTFPGRMEVSINNRKLVPGKDFIIAPESQRVRARGSLKQKDSTHYVNQHYRIILTLEDKLTWSVAREAANFTEIKVDKKALDAIPVDFHVDIENNLIESFNAANVCALVKGTIHPDSVIVISAHYDHLGGMGGDLYFPGANDNASGTSLLLSLAKYYAANPQPYTIAFIAFAGEEAGLVGSKYFTDNPLLPLNNIRFLVNLDLQGTGSEGITVVNATEFPAEYKQLNEINSAGKFLTKINARGKAANSDHYWFTEKDVPAFFFYTLGGIKAYHDIYDRAETLPMNEYNDLFRLIVQFNDKLMNK
jgi:aminopeptidase YwaD